jgi:O-antigen/teichoic acid export membrane protein
MKPARQILANFLNLSAGELVARLLGFAAFAHLARVLGSSDFGRLGLVMTIVAYLQIPVLQGYDSVGMRDVSRDRSLLRRYAGSVALLRLIAAVVTWGIVAVAVRSEIRSLLLWFGLTLFPQALSLKWTFQAVERTRAVAVANIASQMVFAAGAFTVAGPEGLLRVPLWVLAGEGASALILGIVFVRWFGWPQAALDGRLFRESLPLTASSVLGTLLFNFDVLALAWFQPHSAVGLYTAVYKLVLLFAIPLTLFQWSILPSLARYANLRTTAAPALRYLAIVFVPLPFLGWLVAERLLVFLYGAEYAAGSLALRILLFSLPWMAFRSLFRIILVTYHLQRLDLKTVLAGTLTNVAVDLALVPRWGVLGAALATLSSELMIFGISSSYVQRRLQALPVLPHCWRPLVAATAMFAAGVLAAAAPLAVLLAVAASAYLGAAFATGALRWKDIIRL